MATPSSRRYELCAQLGRGGTSLVWLGRGIGAGPGDAGLFAIKAPLPGHPVHRGPGDAVHEEARISACIRHPNVVPTLDVVTTGDERMLVMPYVHGVTLAALLRGCIRAKTTCPVDVAARIAHDLLLGLDAAHRATTPEGTPLGLVHRDVSPQNVLVGTDGVARLIDFGIAKTIASEEQTPRGEMKGKAPYLAPEVLDGKPATALTDVYSAAVVLWEALCARRLFSGRTAIDILVAILATPVPRPSDVRGVPPALDEAVMHGLSRAPSARPRTAREFADEIARAVELAPRGRVAEWVRTNAGDELTRREDLLEEVAARPNGTGGVRARSAFPELPPAPRTVVMPRPAATPLPRPGPASVSSPGSPAPVSVPPPAAVRRGSLVFLGILVVISLLATLAASVHALASASAAAKTFRVTIAAPASSNEG